MGDCSKKLAKLLLTVFNAAFCVINLVCAVLFFVYVFWQQPTSGINAVVLGCFCGCDRPAPPHGVLAHPVRLR